MYAHEPPERIDLRRLELLEACPAAGAGAGSKLPAANLDRWKALHQACVSWFNTPADDQDTADEIADRLFGTVDPVQREILELGFAAFLRLRLKEPGVGVDLEPLPNTVTDASLNAQLKVHYQFELDDGEEVTAVRLRTGRSGTDELEAAVFYTTCDEGMVLMDALVGQDDHAVVDRPDPDSAARLIAETFDRHRLVSSSTDRSRRPGLHCYRCPRPARCGQYPVIGSEPSYSTRTLVLSKTRLVTMSRCERAAAWPAAYGIPKDGGDEPGEGPSTMVGSAVHEALAAALVAGDPGPVIEAAARNALPSEASEIRHLCEQHLWLWRSEPHRVDRVSQVEYQMGVTFTVPGVTQNRYGDLLEQPVAVVMMGTTDVNGWEVDGTPAVVEHRTGRQSTALPHETDLYAVSAWQALHTLGREVDAIAVHVHHLRREPPECERLVYRPVEIEAATARLREVAERAGRWHPTDALGPGFTVGPWCEWCDHARRCVRFR